MADQVDTASAGVGMTGAALVVLVRYRVGVVGETMRTVHVVPLRTGRPTGALSAVCGAILMSDGLETVKPGEGMPCTTCVIHHATGDTTIEDSPADNPGSAQAAEPADYQQWGWPVTVHRGQIRLSLDRHVSALAISASLSTTVTRILTQRRCAPAVLAHPYAPEHRIVLTGEKYGVMLPWPAQMHQVTGVLLLPPTVTARGPIMWTQPPQLHSLRRCREIDLFGAVRTALHGTGPGDPLRAG